MSYTEPLLFLGLAICAFAAAGLPGGSRRKLILGLGLLGLFLLSWPPAEWVISRPLEFSYPIRPFHTTLPAGAIVVLSGGISRPTYERPYPIPDRDTFEHCAMAAWIYNHGNPLPILACEGYQPRGHFAPVMRGLLRSNGISDDQIWIEERSRNTHENALYGAAILRQHGIHQVILVTDAQSMPRTSACFRKFGISVIPAPSEFGELEFSADGLLPNWRAIRRNERTLHETLGLAWYKLNGWI
jgi:uncharacterized SAM-binding protein YcdF (DUF218 family)